MIPLLMLATALAAQAAAPPKPATAKPPAAKPATVAVDAIARQAAAARDAGRLDEAVALYRKALAARPSWDEGRWYLGSTLYEQQKWAQARDAFAALTARQPAHAGAVAMKGLCEFELGEHETALRTLLQARALGIARTPEIAHVVAYNAGILLTRFEEFEVGYAVLSELATDNVESAKVIEALGMNLLRMPMLPAALPENRRPLVQLAGRAAFAMAGRRLGDAARLFDEMVATYPNEPNVHYARGVLRTTESPDGALEDFRRELEISPTHIPARLQIVFELVKRGEAASAKATAEEAVRLDPEHFAPHLALGQVWLETGETAKAIAAFERGVALAPSSPQAHFLLARGYARAGRTADAERERQIFQKLERARPGRPGDPERPVP